MKAQRRKARIRDGVFNAVAAFYARTSSMSRRCPIDRPVLVFADGTFASNALMLEPIVYEIAKKKAVVWGYEYSVPVAKSLQDKGQGEYRIRQCNIQEWFLIRIFSLYRRSLLRPLGFFVYIVLLTLWFHSVSPSMLILANDIMFSSRFLAFLARAKGIPALSLQHGAVGPAHFPMIADRFGVYSESVRQHIVTNGWLEADRIIAIGNPRWDKLASREKKKRMIGQILILSQAASIDVLGAVDPNIAALFSLVERLAVEYRDKTFVVRLHPLEDGRHWTGYEQRFANVYIQRSDSVELVEALASSDCVLSGSTTAFYEAAILKLPCISFRPHVDSTVVPPVTEMDSFLLVAKSESAVVDIIDGLYRMQGSEPVQSLEPVSNMGCAARAVSTYVFNKIMTQERPSD